MDTKPTELVVGQKWRFGESSATETIKAERLKNGVWECADRYKWTMEGKTGSQSMHGWTFAGWADGFGPPKSEVIGAPSTAPVAGIWECNARSHIEAPYGWIRQNKGPEHIASCGCDWHRQVVLGADGSVVKVLSWVSPDQKRTVAAAPALAVAVRRQVSSDGGRTWVDYERLADGDAWDTYECRRLVKGGVVSEVHGLPTPPVRLKPSMALAVCAWRQVSHGALMNDFCKNLRAHARAPYCEAHIAEDMRARDAERPQSAPPRPEIQSHTSGFVGVWSTRAIG